MAALAALAVFAVVAFYLWRDLRLGASNIIIPDIVVENIEIKRVIDGNVWVLVSPRAEHKQGLLHGTSVDITVTADNGDVSRMFAVEGTFSRTNNDITFESLSADVAQGKKNIIMIAGRARYDSASNIWYFSDDVMISDGAVEASGPEGSYDSGAGLSIITGGGTVKWLDS